MSALHILIVDDDVDYAHSLAMLLEADGHTVDVVHDGASALAISRSQSFDVTLMDMKLPDQDGIESFRQIKAVKPLPATVLVTGFATPDHMDTARSEGMLEAFLKPLDLARMEALLGSVERLKTVLIADDDEDYAATTRDLLVGAGYRVLVAGDGEQAVQHALGGRVDVVLLDLRMPALHGAAAYRRMREDGLDARTVIVTGFALEEAAAIDELQRLGVTDVVSKPLDPVRLVAQVGALV